MVHLLDLAPELLDHILGYVLAFEDDGNCIPDSRIRYCRETKSYSRCVRAIPLATTCRLFYELNRWRMLNSSCNLLLSFKEYPTPADDYNNEQIKRYEENGSLGKCRELTILGTRLVKNNPLGYINRFNWGSMHGSICDCGEECCDDDGSDEFYALVPCDRLKALAAAGQDRISPLLNTILPRSTNLTTASFHHDDHGIPIPAFIEGIRTLLHGCLGLKELFLNIALSYQNHIDKDAIKKLDASKPYAHLEVLRLQFRMEARWKDGAEMPDMDGHPRLLTALHKVLELPTRTVQTLQYSKIGYPLDEDTQDENTEEKFWSLPALKTLDVFLNKSTFMQLEAGNAGFIFDPRQVKHLKISLEYSSPTFRMGPLAMGWADPNMQPTPMDQADNKPGADSAPGNLVEDEDKGEAEGTDEDDGKSTTSYGSTWEYDYEFNIYQRLPGGYHIVSPFISLFPALETLDILNIGSRRREDPGLSEIIDEIKTRHPVPMEISTNLYLGAKGHPRDIFDQDPDLLKYKHTVGRRHLSCHTYPKPVGSHDAVTLYMQTPVNE
ncbi:hypothetical protein TWF696_004946 [Orbilia brochopaga]|uniref:F-box domain-containing protein n=1 Tax=Orbilia brochopaga TaxID=3140254 RepID=A0AAV9UZJ8_9PEZI